MVGREDVSVLMPKNPGRPSGSGVDAFGRQDAYPAETRVLCHVVGMRLGSEPRARSPIYSTADEHSLDLRPWRTRYALFDRRCLLVFS